ncbi:LPXTG cell wall anchor domain-containing protein, partial [Subdoligranulum variabile]|uniref:LPXTG cell wall anchor domain-containing protein n=1 Tax=Subdoligranulum variabile TaxID=214851 RepID=UPI0026EE0333
RPPGLTTVRFTNRSTRQPPAPSPTVTPTITPKPGTGPVTTPPTQTPAPTAAPASTLPPTGDGFSPALWGGLAALSAAGLLLLYRRKRNRPPR